MKTLIYSRGTCVSPSHFQDYWTNVSPQTRSPHNCLTLCSLSDHNPATTVSPSAMLEYSHRKALYSEKEEWFKRQSCSPQWSLVLKCGTILLNINLLFIHVHINLPTILSLDHHWDNLATNTLRLLTLHSRDNMPILIPACHPRTLHTHVKILYIGS